MIPDDNTNVGFVGLGKVGQTMARLIHRTGALTAVHNQRAEVTSDFSGEVGVPVAQSTAEMRQACGVVVLALLSGNIVRNVVLGADDYGDYLTANPRKDFVIVDTSLSAPTGMRALAEALARKAVGMLDTPVSSGVKKAQSGELSIMVGGEPGLIDKLRRLLESMEQRIFAAGPSGSGHALRSLNNLSGTHAAGFAFDLMAKDVATTNELAQQSASFAP